MGVLEGVLLGIRVLEGVLLGIGVLDGVLLGIVHRNNTLEIESLEAGIVTFYQSLL